MPRTLHCDGFESDVHCAADDMTKFESTPVQYVRMGNNERWTNPTQGRINVLYSECLIYIPDRNPAGITYHILHIPYP